MPSKSEMFHAMCAARAALWWGTEFDLRQARRELREWADRLGIEPETGMEIIAAAFFAAQPDFEP